MRIIHHHHSNPTLERTWNNNNIVKDMNDEIFEPKFNNHTKGKYELKDGHGNAALDYYEEVFQCKLMINKYV